ncbi:hypothetical protein TWF225_009601 [Orbilia oligospora]|uniref:Uncharacterized protein n=1 Tax=Orbilia oligospora TaxID=2813651 RepID=A0A7C8PCX7_ORBOL|nr:hypothetical protein TWF751_010789 [Orbilia oligospora]KAF3174178.1 hypothetical protein TWF225_009601 [Orbilia oligospora]KAF3249850.1 hypothetical protein TWF217_008757 [Orbilia oligospora]KAF3259336.1 hypothetical protein TWF128_004403 [Orbilia oligospora]KAF3292501.1 hypothetical protein TWF132_005553 [Orbilia oligospora]
MQTTWATETRSRFPAVVGTGQAYMDNAGGSQVLDVVIDSIKDYLSSTNVQLGASYVVGTKSNELFAAGLLASAKFINADPGEVVLGSASTQLLHNLSSALKFPTGSEIIVSATDHETNVAPWLRLAENQGHTIKFWKPSPAYEWTLQLSDLKPLLSPKTVLVAFTNCSNITGTIHDVKSYAEFIREKYPDVLVAIDGVAFTPHRPIDVKALGVDFFVFSWYKVYGPHISLLYAAPRTQKFITPLSHFFNPKDTLFDKLNLAGGNYELTASLPHLVEFLTPQTWEGIKRQEEVLSKTFIDWVLSRPDTTLYGTKETSSEKRVPVLSFSVKGWGSKDLVEAVEKEDSRYGIRWGHFYAKRLIDSFGLEKPDEGIVRVSLLFYNTVEEVEGLIKVFEKILGSK